MNENFNENGSTTMEPEKKSFLDIPPRLNIISKENFEKRTRDVFSLICDSIGKSFGPFGAPTLIYNYPDSHVTKDGYTIMSNLSMDASHSLLDVTIKGMIEEICGRLNYTVGDGTTSAVVATDSIYQSYMHYRDQLTSQNILPRDILRKFKTVKDMITEEISKYVTQIRSDDPDVLRENIRKVVNVSSNGDTVMTDYVSDLYKELMCPSITAITAPDGITKTEIINGYKFQLYLADRMYINSDNQTLNLQEADVLIFDYAVDDVTYENIIKPMNAVCRARGRKLIVAAIRYDETTLATKIARELNAEHSKTNDINLVITVYKALSAMDRLLINDFAILCNTQIITRKLALGIIEDIRQGKTIDDLFNTDIREIPGLMLGSYNPATHQGKLYRYGDTIPEGYDRMVPSIENPFLLGYVGECSLGLKYSIFNKFFYNTAKYYTILDEARAKLEEVTKKYARLGTFNLEVSQAQNRYYSLLLRMGIIYVGFDSELSRGLELDAVEDDIKAAASAFDHGIISGCNVTLSKAIDDVMQKTDPSSIEYLLLSIIKKGFADVYKKVLSNGYVDSVLLHLSPSALSSKEETLDTIFDSCLAYVSDNSDLYADGDIDALFPSRSDLIKAIEAVFETKGCEEDITFFDIIVAYSIQTNMAFDVTTRQFTHDIVNSAETDRQILAATTDLIALLITGNQVIVTQRHNFN